LRKMQGEEFNELVDFFDKMAQTKWLSAVHNQLKQLSGDWTDKKVLDVGCGTGRLLLRGAHEAGQLIGIDLSPKMIEAGKQNFKTHHVENKATLQTGDAYNLPLEDNSVDVSLSTCVMFLLPEPEKGMQEMIRVTKTGGTVTMLNPSEIMDVQHAETYCQRHNIQGFEKETLLKWSNVSTLRHRYSGDQLTSLLKKQGAETVQHYEMLDGLALVTVFEL
jgi:ubiquinone/menaquinone biosynthesis C-methylase UbiE